MKTSFEEMRAEGTINTLEAAVQALVERDPDFATIENMVGFNKPDSWVGHEMANRPESEWLEIEKWMVYELLKKYRVQLSNYGIDYKAIPEPPRPAEPERRAKEYHEQRVERREAQKAKQREIERIKQTHIIDWYTNQFRLVFPYSDLLLNKVRELDKPLRYFTKHPVTAWLIIANPSVISLLDYLLDFGFAISDNAKEKLEQLRSNPAQVQAQPKVEKKWNSGTISALENRLTVSFDVDWNNEKSKQQIETVKVLARSNGGRWEKDLKIWSFPSTSLDAIRKTFPTFTLDEKAQAISDHTQQKIKASKAAKADLFIAGLGGELMPFQKAGVSYAIEHASTATGLSVLIGDQMGLGKTVQALATLQAKNSFPCLIVCPASLKLNWKKEAQRWLPGKRVELLNGKSSLYTSDIYIINYDILSDGWASEDAEGNPVKKNTVVKLSAHINKLMPVLKAVVYDEFHYNKNYKAQRTVASKQIATAIAVKIGLTGTPVVNRPSELVPQLEILDRIKELGGKSYFYKRYCEAYNDGYGFNTSGAAHLDELNERMRASFYIRRLKEDVLKELPAKMRCNVSLDIDNRAEYNRCKNDLCSWLKEQVHRDEEFLQSISHLSPKEQEIAKREKANTSAEKARRAETLVKINALKKITVDGKMSATIEWVNNFVESGRKLLLFCHHTDVAKRLAKEFNADLIIGETKIEARQAAVERFQADENVKVIVLNLKAGGVGLTLTAASDVAFVEFGWNPADMDQALDRTHRIGQTRQVTGWYLIAEATIDEKINQLIDAKRIVVDAATDGNEEATQESMLNALVVSLLED